MPFLGLLAFLEIVLKFIARIYRFIVIALRGFEKLSLYRYRTGYFFYRFIVIGLPENLSLPTSDRNAAQSNLLYRKMTGL